MSSSAALSEQWVEICSVSDLIPNSGVAALLGDTQVAIYYLPKEEQQLFALDNHDPFSKSNTMSRGILGDLQEQLVVAAPIYKQHFNLMTGQCLEDESASLRSYPVKLDGDKVLLAV